MEDDVLELVIFAGASRVGARVFPASRVITIGSAPEAAVRLDDSSIGARHAVVYMEGGLARIADHDGRSVILVNGAPTRGSVVQEGDEVRLGIFRLEIHHIPAAPSYTAVDENESRTDAEVRATTPPERRVLEPPSLRIDSAMEDAFGVVSSTRPDPIVEVVHYRYGALIDTHQVGLGGRFSFSMKQTGAPFELVRVDGQGGVRIYFARTHRGYVAREQSADSIESLCVDQNLADESGLLFETRLSVGEYAHVELEREAYFIRFMRSPIPPPILWALGFPRERRGSSSGGQRLH
ncbi:MAG: FHA domain-containing protein [Myxococcota bacterium]